jgi:APA family basic amino acid/polyamine antiporter
VSAPEPALRRSLGPWTASAIVVGTVIGSGIFLVPSDMVRAVGSPAMVFFVWIFGGLLTLAGALTYAELAAALPDAGGTYTYLRVAYGPLWGFLYGWTETWMMRPASWAAFGAGFYAYLSDFFPRLQQIIFVMPLPVGPGGAPLEIRYGQFVAIGIILFLCALNYIGARIGGDAQVILTGLKLALIAGLVIFGITSGAASSQNLHITGVAAPGGIPGFFIALVAALWAYDGWANASLLGSEVQKPHRDLPLALIAGTAATIAVYLLVNLAYFLVLPGPEVGSSAKVAADMMRRAAGSGGAAAVSVAAMISTFAALNGSILSGSRVPYAMARDGYFFRPIAHVHPVYRTPAASLLLLGLWASVLVLSGRYQELYTMVVFPSWILYGMAAAAVMVLRKRCPNLPRPYRAWGYPIIPGVFVLVAVALLFSTIRSSPRESGIGLATILIGLPFYFHWKSRKGE